MNAPFAPLEIRSHERPRLQDGGLLIEVLASEVCGTDVHLHHGRLDSVPWPIIPGHVSCGRVVETSGSPKDPFGGEIRAGDVVTFYDVFGQCGSCYSCLVAKQETRCPHRRVYGITTSARDGLLGGWATHIELRPGVRTVKLPEGHGEITVRVRIVPTEISFDADLLDVAGGTAKIALRGALGPRGLKYLEEQIDAARSQNVSGILFDMSKLESISSEALRYLLFNKQTFGPGFKLSVTGANPEVKSAIEASELSDEISWV